MGEQKRLPDPSAAIEQREPAMTAPCEILESGPLSFSVYDSHCHLHVLHTVYGNKYTWQRTPVNRCLTSRRPARIFVVENINKGAPVATVNYSVPDEVKELFNRTFAGRNKSAIVAEMMVQAVEEEEREERSTEAIHSLLARLDTKPVVTREEIRAAREELRR
jgi:hypothetical protein